MQQTPSSVPSLRELRKARRLSQVTVAKMAGVSKGVITRWEMGERIHRLSFGAVCRALKIKHDQIQQPLFSHDSKASY